MIEKIRLYGDEVLRQKAKPISDIQKVQSKIDNLLETLEANDEFALAAPQIGYSLRMFAIRTIWKEEKDDIETMLFINPEMLEFEGMQNEPEGCLSIPEIYEKVKRAKKIKFKAQNRFGKKKEYIAEDLFARAVQHENDHLDGILFIDKLPTLKRKFLQGKLNKIVSTTKNGVNVG
ncbi:MAG: peptide deformylase [Candidatus Cloacimonetes bacterium]|nr:peptide deformylase [Candidatus Cloacimonadota bacterium]MBS3766506.1 peptide deformylase [Candidatus Cloacimonadota bacterium]